MGSKLDKALAELIDRQRARLHALVYEMQPVLANLANESVHLHTKMVFTLLADRMKKVLDENHEDGERLDNRKDL